mgnify:CR=1 FL=1
MDNKIQDAFSYVKADPALKEATKDFLATKRKGQSFFRARAVYRTFAAVCAMLLLAVGLAAGFALWSSKKRSLMERILGKVPVCAAILESLGMFRFTAALSTFLASGEMQDIAVAESVKMTSCRKVEEKVNRCVGRMSQGHGIAQAAYEVLYEGRDVHTVITNLMQRAKRSERDESYL